MCGIPYFLAACIACAPCIAAGFDRGAQAKIAGPSPRAYAYVVVSVGDMEKALDLWEERFGMEMSRRESGADAGLSRIWGLPGDAIAEQVLLNTPGMIDGGVHLVRFAHPGEPVLADSTPADLGPRSLEIAVLDIEARRAELAAAGHAVEERVREVRSGRHAARETRLRVHDAVEITLREGPGKTAPLSSRGYGVAPQLAAVVPEVEREVVFFQEVLGLVLLSASVPAADAPDVRILGARDSRFGRVALVQYATSIGEDLYPRAVPPARGLLSVTYVVPDLAPILARGRAAGIADHGEVRSILGEGRMASVTSPAGLRIDFIQL